MKKVVKTLEKKNKLNKTNFGVVGLTLAISGIFLLIPCLIANAILMPIISLIFFIISLVFSIRQQNKNPTKAGKYGLIISIIGIILSIIIFLIILLVILPYVQNLIASKGIQI
jgi:uncharacterized membrane protein HdeD (DUF308 family)